MYIIINLLKYSNGIDSVIGIYPDNRVDTIVAFLQIYNYVESNVKAANQMGKYFEF